MPSDAEKHAAVRAASMTAAHVLTTLIAENRALAAENARYRAALDRLAAAQHEDSPAAVVRAVRYALVVLEFEHAAAEGPAR